MDFLCNSYLKRPGILVLGNFNSRVAQHREYGVIEDDK